MGTLIIARHSITEASAAGRNLGQRSDPPLAADGLALAARLGDTLRAELDELPHDDLRLLSSPALRCRQTAGEVIDAIGVPSRWRSTRACSSSTTAPGTG